MLATSIRRFGTQFISRNARKFSSVPTEGSSSGSAEIWDWVPPATAKIQPLNDIKNYVLPIIEGVNITAEEVRDYLESQGAENVVLIDDVVGFDPWKKGVFASGRSLRHIRKMTEGIHANQKARRLKKIMGIEGEKDDDWQAVDCHTFLVNVMSPKTRRCMDLESHWRSKNRGSLPPRTKHNEREYEAQFQALLHKHPCPDEYINTDDFVLSDLEVKEF